MLEPDLIDYHKILRLDSSGRPVEWLHWSTAVCLYARDLVQWTYGEEIMRIRGGWSSEGLRSEVFLHSVIACKGHSQAWQRRAPPLTNSALFSRDQNICMYCGGQFAQRSLEREHVVPLSRGGKDVWNNVVASCRRCNQRKGSRRPEECGMELMALPYTPNHAEYLSLLHGRRILADQMDFLRHHFTEAHRERH